MAHNLKTRGENSRKRHPRMWLGEPKILGWKAHGCRFQGGPPHLSFHGHPGHLGTPCLDPKPESGAPDLPFRVLCSGCGRLGWQRGGLERFWGEQRAQGWVPSGGAGWWGDWHLAPGGRGAESGGSYGWAQPCREGCEVQGTSEGRRWGARGTPAGRPRADHRARSVAEADKSIRPGERRGDFFPHGGWLAGRGSSDTPSPSRPPTPPEPRVPGSPASPGPARPIPELPSWLRPESLLRRCRPFALALSLSPFSPPLSSCHPPLSPPRSLPPLPRTRCPSAAPLGMEIPARNSDSDPARPDCLAPQLQSLGHRFFIWSGVLLGVPPPLSRPA